MGNEFDFGFWLEILLFIVFPLFMLGVLILLALLVCVHGKGLQNQRRMATALEAMNKTNAVILDALKDLKGVAPAAAETTDEEDGEPVSEQEEDDSEVETPADFVYCPVCSTRVEVDPTVRNVNVVCPDCKKPFHIH